MLEIVKVGQGEEKHIDSKLLYLMEKERSFTDKD